MTQSNDPDWWRQAVIYQIYPRSFQDTNGDGIGDLRGITSRAKYLHDLGIDAVWLSPFYPSPLADGGYDVADYRNVDPRIGTLEDFDEMVAALKPFNIRVIVDIVPNHTSTDHELFKKAIASKPGSAERDFFIFRDGKGPDKAIPPNDWESVFGGVAWDSTGQNDGQFYFHQFAKEQPDWNWDNPAVREDFLKTLRFWGDRGVSGFRVDVASALVKDMSEPFISWKELQALGIRKNKRGNTEVSPLYDRDEVQEVYAGWRKVFNEYDPPLVAVAEAWVAPDREHLYASKKSLGQVFSFGLAVCNFNAEQYRDIIEYALKFSKETGSSSTWVLSNHDLVRHVSRFGLPDHPFKDGLLEVFHYYGGLMKDGKWATQPDLAKGQRKARAAVMTLLALPGCMYIYQGEELGLPEVVEIPPEERQDPVYLRSNGAMTGRDGCRVPLPWDSSKPSFGYTTGKAHISLPSWFKEYSVDLEEKSPDSFLSLYRRAAALRKTLQTNEDLEFVSSEKGVLHFKRPNGWEVIMNANDHPVSLPNGAGSRVVLSSGSLGADGQIPGECTVWLGTSSAK